MLGGVAGELLRVELAGSDDEVEDRLLRLDAEHDRRVPELQVEVEQQRALALALRERGGQVRRDDRLARPALRREHRHEPPSRSTAAARRRSGVRGLADREHDVLRQLRQQSTSATSASSASSRSADGSPDATSRIGARVCSRIAASSSPASVASARAVQDTVEVAPCEGADGRRNLVTRPDDLELRLVREGVAELVEPFARAGHVHPDDVGVSVVVGVVAA